MTGRRMRREVLLDDASLATKFVADAMLGSLARKLRVFGFDTAYFREGDDSELIDLARTEGRVILTSDRALAVHSKKHRVAALLVEGSTDRSRLRSFVDESRKSRLSLAPGETRCPSCNERLVVLRRVDVLGTLPEKVSRRHRVYYRCPVCAKLYWKGIHWKRMRRLSSVITQRRTASRK